MAIYNYTFKDGFTLEAVPELDIFKKRRYITAHGKIMARVKVGWKV